MKFLIVIFIFSLSTLTMAQSVMDELDGNSIEGLDLPPLATEKISKISLSGRIIILSNSNNSFGKGDFITIIKDNKMAVRAITAKVTSEGMAGVKLLRVYDLNTWKTVGPGSEVQVLKGDDTAFRNAAKGKDEEDLAKIKDEEDLFNKETLLEDDQSFEEKSNRYIKQDNIVSMGYGSVESLENTGASARSGQFHGSWSYQIQDNIWVEALYGQSIMNDFPNSGLDTRLSNITFRAKYTFEAPFYSYLKPYLGYQIVSADSPGAGVQSSDGDVDASTLESETTLVSNLGQNRVVFGVTALKRLVPGWFLRADIGSDILSIGAGLEF